MASEIFKFESVDDDDDGRRRRRTDDGPLVYYKLTLWAFGSGELIIGYEGSAISTHRNTPNLSLTLFYGLDNKLLDNTPGVGRNTLFLSSPHLCFIIVFIRDLFVSRDDPLTS